MFPCLLSAGVQALAVELTDQVSPQDVGVDLQQGAQLQTQRGPPVSLGAIRGGRGGRVAGGWDGRIVDSLHPGRQHPEEELNTGGRRET
ncbi:hypothetical protein CgunFtcFv8_011435 [Champsocephalus gunnari]|uniref:Uncharacterized protein n=1 Tax=Champsocephalus gunnari TaxID=52237 RepID=A0AAN8D9T3_CHAGU|nr:hypothetical protein CgunFtcFv8_011435 [Champsocephalus gunnari]